MNHYSSTRNGQQQLAIVNDVIHHPVVTRVVGDNNTGSSSSNGQVPNNNVNINVVVPGEPDQSLTVFVRQSVRRDKRHIYDEWCRTINTLAQGFDGFISTEVIRPTFDVIGHNNNSDEVNSPISSSSSSRTKQDEKDSDEYIAIIRFNNYSNLQKWISSNERKYMMGRVNEYSDAEPIFSYNSLEHWFTSETVSDSTGRSDGSSTSSSHPASNVSSSGPPPRYKMWMVTCVVIYCQVLWVPKFTTLIVPPTKNLDPIWFKLINTVLTVTFSTYIIFPIVTRLLTFWLFPTRNYKNALCELIPFRRTIIKILSSHSTATSTGEQKARKLASSSSVSTETTDDTSESTPLLRVDPV